MAVDEATGAPIRRAGGTSRQTHTQTIRTSISIILVALGALAGCQSNMAGSQHENHAQGGAMHSSSDGAMPMPAGLGKSGTMMASCQEMKHMESGKESVTQCPMMTGMKNMGEE